MCNLWIACSLYDHDLPGRMSARVRRAMTFLMSKSIEAVQTSHPSKRLELAVDCWEYLTKDFPKRDDPLPRQQPPAQSQPKQEKQESADLGEGEGEGTGGDESQGKGQASGRGEAAEEGEAEGTGQGEGEEGEEEEAETEGAGGSGDGEADEEDTYKGSDSEAEGDTEPEAEPDHFSDEAIEPQEEGEAMEGGEQGGDEQGSPGNLDEFDIRDIEEIPEELLNEVLDAITHELEDLTKSVAEVINKPAWDVDAQTRKADYDAPAAERVRQQVESEIQEMRRVFDRQAQVQSRYLKGLTVGKLDRRSLSRAGAGNFRVFKRREVLETPDLAVGLLLDVSGSMHDKMDYVWAAGSVFAEGLIRKRGVNFLALTYTGGMFNCQTTRICDRDMGRLCLGNVEQGGGTPSGVAIASIKVLMDRMPERQKVIIHFTDGWPDDKYSVMQAVEAARKAGYWVWAISLRGYESMLAQQYGDGNWETIAAIRELPSKVAHLVQKLAASR